MIDRDMAIKLVSQFARAVRESEHKLANNANQAYVAQLHAELVDFLTGVRQ